jgi:hypothetical protein
MNLSFPAVQPGTEEARDLAYLRQLAAQPTTATPGVAAPSAAAPTSATVQPAAQQPVTPSPAAPQTSVPALERREPSAEAPRAGVNSMFGM